MKNETYQAALSIIEKLQRRGFEAYFAGGFVRDLLLKKHSQDIDIATNAKPHEVQKIFPNTLPVGKAFGIVIVCIGKIKIEVATFRKDSEYIDGRHPKSVSLLSSAKEDAMRRDFTINGMFYDPVENEIIDYVEGQLDIKKKIVRTIGNPRKRFEEDKLRMMRAIRFSNTLAFQLEENTKIAISDMSRDICNCVSIERIWQELKKIFSFGMKVFGDAIIDMYVTGILGNIFGNSALKDENDILHCVNSFGNLQKQTPMIIPLLTLLKTDHSKSKVEIFKNLKVANKDIKWVSLYEKIEKLENNNDDDIQWVKAYATAGTEICLSAILALQSPAQRLSRTKYHEHKKNKFHSQIQRIKEKNPVVKSLHLKNAGILPGKVFGEILAKAEERSIKLRLEDHRKILETLGIKTND